jgi:hypothetical protein
MLQPGEIVKFNGMKQFALFLLLAQVVQVMHIFLKTKQQICYLLLKNTHQKVLTILMKTLSDLLKR